MKPEAYNNLEEWVREEVDRLSVPPEPEVWERLEDSLDRDEVWGRLDASLNRDRDRAFWFKRLAVAAAVLALFAIGLWQLTPSNLTGESTHGFAAAGQYGTADEARPDQLHFPAEMPTETRPTENTTSLEREFASQSGNVVPPSDGKSSANNGQAQPQAENTFASQNANSDSEHPLVNSQEGMQDEDAFGSMALVQENETPGPTRTERDSQMFVQSLRKQKVTFGSLKQELPQRDLEAAADAAMDSLVEEFVFFEDPEKNTSLFYVGASAGLKNQWLMNHETYKTFSSDGLDYAQADFSSVQNLNFGWQFAERFGVQTDYSFLAGGGQKYQDYAKGRFVGRELDFQYQKLLVSFRYNRKPKSLFGKNISDQFALGMYGGYLTEAQRIGGIEGSAKFLPEYRNVDFGFTGAYEVNYALIPRLKLSTGLRIQHGVMNIYKGSSTVPADFNRTFNASLDFLMGLKYDIQKFR